MRVSGSESLETSTREVRLLWVAGEMVGLYPNLCLNGDIHSSVCRRTRGLAKSECYQLHGNTPVPWDAVDIGLELA